MLTRFDTAPGCQGTAGERSLAAGTISAREAAMRMLVRLVAVMAAGTFGPAEAGVTVSDQDAVTSKSGPAVVGRPVDVSKTPSPGGPVPIPYPNTGMNDPQGRKPAKGAPASAKDKRAIRRSADEAARKTKVESLPIKQSGAALKPDGRPVLMLTPLDTAGSPAGARDAGMQKSANPPPAAKSVPGTTSVMVLPHRARPKTAVRARFHPARSPRRRCFSPRRR
jgi:hypothetical protein